MDTFVFSDVYESKEEMMKRAIDLATEIASKSPVAVAATKLQLNYGRDHTVDEGLDYIVSFMQLPYIMPLVSFYIS